MDYFHSYTHVSYKGADWGEGAAPLFSLPAWDGGTSRAATHKGVGKERRETKEKGGTKEEERARYTMLGWILDT